MNGWARRQITIEKPVMTVDADSGTEVISWEPLAPLPGSPTVAIKFWALYRDVIPSNRRAAEELRDGLVLLKSRAELLLRYRGDITPDMRVILHGDTDIVYAIVGGPTEIGRKEDLQLLLERYSS